MNKIVLSTLGLVAALGLAACSSQPTTKETKAAATHVAPVVSQVSSNYYKCKDGTTFTFTMEEVKTADKTDLQGKLLLKGSGAATTLKNVESASGILFKGEDKTEVFVKNLNALYVKPNGKQVSCTVVPAAKATK